MVISQAQRAETAVTEMLAAADDGSVAAVDLRTALEISKAIASKLATFQARAAAALAARESHGDGGAGVLRHATGVSRRQAEGQARAVRVLDDMPLLRDALEAGKVSLANAARLAEAAEATNADAVQADAELLAKAESMPDDLFSREARRWAARHQPDDGEAVYARRRARRSVRMWDGEDGMTHLRGEFDPVTGERTRNRLEAEARRVRQTDPRSERRSFAQAMADALDGMTAIGAEVGQYRKRSRTDSHGHDANGRAGSSQTRTSQDDKRRDRTSPAGNNQTRTSQDDKRRDRTSPDDASRKDSGERSGDDGRENCGSDGDWSIDSIGKGKPIADIAVVSHVDSETGALVSQLATGEPLPPSVLEMLACNASITGILYDTAGTPLWRGTTKRTATAAQLKALIARDGGCVGCGCHPALCQAHHIKPASQGGPTTISNMVLLCWHCHHKVHHNQWTVARRHGRFELLPPVRTHWGPARAPDPPPSGRPTEPLFNLT
ncbi:MAG: DUF222 domain-containing protein [Acidimicrobiaceae bacterium]|nr:DUF222 domain-containing protein [Acidimicrobiaceae bacterium]